MREHENGFTAEQWKDALDRIAQNLSEPARLCLMGSATNLFEGMQGRMSIDLDVWRRMSQFSEPTLKKAVEAAGLIFNPTAFEEPDRPYIQIVDPGVAHVGEFSSPAELLPQNGKLGVTRPPIENLIAAKLLRMKSKDIEDVEFLLQQHPEVSVRDVVKVVKTMPKEHREIANENMVYLEVIAKQPRGKDLALSAP